MKYKITMRCNEKQFKAIKPKLKNHVEFYLLSDFNKKQRFYLINHLSSEKNKVTNVTSPILPPDVEFHETWNDKIFLQACGIEVEETFTITKEQILDLMSTAKKGGKADTKMRTWFPSSFEPEKKELVFEAGKWYKYPDYQKWNLHVTEVDYENKKVKGYGFGADGNWMKNALNDSWDFEELKLCVEMTQQEVKEALKAVLNWIYKVNKTPKSERIIF